MNKLFYITAYSHRVNDWERFLVSGPNEEACRAAVRTGLAPGWGIRGVRFVCMTPDRVYELA